MELDFKTIKALSSPTRINILNSVLDKEATPTYLSRELDKSKSTISSHLENLQKAELVRKKEEEGRKRVIYEPTKKAEHIVKGKERKVRFALTSSITSAIIGATLVFQNISIPFNNLSSASTEDKAKIMAEQASDQETAASGMASDISSLILILGISLLLFSASTLAYSILIKRIGAQG